MLSNCPVSSQKLQVFCLVLSLMLLLWWWPGVFCGPPGDILNGYLVLVSGPYSGDTATYACETGFQLSSSTPIKCRNTGSWDTPPFCFCESSSLSTHLTSLFFCMTSVCDAATPHILSSKADLVQVEFVGWNGEIQIDFILWQNVLKSMIMHALLFLQHYCFCQP